MSQFIFIFSHWLIRTFILCVFLRKEQKSTRIFIHENRTGFRFYFLFLHIDWSVRRFFVFCDDFGKVVAENASKKKIFLNNHLAFGGYLAVPLRQSLFKFK
jgi:hypothetical protein